jgi:hypothetical protein
VLTKEKAEKLIKIKGESRGANITDDWNFILENKGSDGLRRLEEKIAELGFPLKKKDIRPMKFYPIGLNIISTLLIKELFNFTEKDFERMGIAEVKFSLMAKIFMKYFVSPELISKQIPKMWRKYYTIGDLEIPEYSKENKYIVLRLKNFKINPIFCNTYKGFFSKVAQMAVKSPVVVKETKCMFKGNPYHEFLLTW